jgi:hypothetical protein
MTMVQPPMDGAMRIILVNAQAGVVIVLHVTTSTYRRDLRRTSGS